MQFSLLLLICHLTTYVLLQLLFQVDETNDCAKQNGHAGVTINKIPSAHACSYEACYESSLTSQWLANHSEILVVGLGSYSEHYDTCFLFASLGRWCDRITNCQMSETQNGASRCFYNAATRHCRYSCHAPTFYGSVFSSSNPPLI